MGRMSTIETYTGGFVDYDDPDPASIDVHDIARALSTTCRFGGHVERFYSVAEHACLVRHIVRAAGRHDLGFAALHHDSHEAYVGDVPTPLKLALGKAYEKVRDRLDVAIAEALGLPLESFHAPGVVAADREALFCEAAVLKVSGGVGPHWGRDTVASPPPWRIGLSPRRAEELFLTAHKAERSVNG